MRSTQTFQVVPDPPEELVVDAANVIGSRPDGWWRDRAAAARALVGQLRAAVTSRRIGGPVTVVLEGEARAGAGAGPSDGVMVLHAPRSGDETVLETIAARGGRSVTLVTADRELRRRAQALGARVVGPGWLLSRLEQDRPSELGPSTG